MASRSGARTVKVVEQILARLADLVVQGRYEALETEAVEIKPVPPDTGSWRQLHRTVNAFLNTRGGIVILGVKEEGRETQRRYVFSGYREEAEAKLKDISRQFTDRHGRQVDVPELRAEILTFLQGRVAVLYVDELAADQKFVFSEGKAYRRRLTGEDRISDRDIEAQEEFKEESSHARELQLVPGVTEADFDLNKLNDFILRLTQLGTAETLKPSLESAKSFLERKGFTRDGRVTTLGILVCGQHPADRLGFRCQVHGYVDAAQAVAQDKQDFADNVLPLMDHSLGYILRNIQVGVSAEQGGTSRPQYPEEVLRETVNNALAHRDYSVNRQVIIAIKPGEHIAIRNPGTFRRHLLVDHPEHAIPVCRIVPEAKPRNPKLADVLRVYRKWEGRSIGMSTLVRFCLENKLDLPCYRLYQEEVCLFLRCGRLVDARMERHFVSFSGHIADRLRGMELTDSQKAVLAYLLKSEWANRQSQYTILLTQDNNHFNELMALEKAGLIARHPLSTTLQPLFVADRVLAAYDPLPELRDLLGPSFDALDNFRKQVLGVVLRFNRHSRQNVASARQTSLTLWEESDGDRRDIRDYETLYRKVKYAFNRLEKSGFLVKKSGTRDYEINSAYLKTYLL